MSRPTSIMLAVSIIAGLRIPAFADESKRQVEVEQKSEHVMPFDMNATMHSFVPTRDGGVQTVLVHNGDAKQVALVRAHLHKEAAAFARGDFTDPVAIHGGTMPGLHALHAGAKSIRIRYTEVPNGAAISYHSAVPKLVSAIHAWFSAQRNDHGTHAGMKM
jgi:hypothetical protein